MGALLTMPSTAGRAEVGNRRFTPARGHSTSSSGATPPVMACVCTGTVASGTGQARIMSVNTKGPPPFWCGAPCSAAAVRMDAVEPVRRKATPCVVWPTPVPAFRARGEALACASATTSSTLSEPNSASAARSSSWGMYRSRDTAPPSPSPKLSVTSSVLRAEAVADTMR